MRFCDECGAQLEDNAVFCEECGAKVELKEEFAENSNVSDNEQSLEITPVPKNKGNKFPLVMICLIAVCTLTGLLISKKGNAPKSNEPKNIAMVTETVSGNGTESEKGEEGTKGPEMNANATMSPSTAAPSTLASETTAPVSKAPTTVESVTTGPATTESATKIPETIVPKTKAPVSKVPVTKVPETKSPTKAPSKNPTKSPTKKPTKEPSKEEKGNYVLTAKYTYNSSGDMIQASDYTYNKSGVLLSENRYISAPEYEEGIYEYYYDKYGNPVKIVRYDLDNKYMYKICYKYVYDDNKNIHTESYEYFDEDEYFDYNMDGYKEYTYYGDNTVEEVYIMTNGRYLYTQKFQYIYDAYGKLLTLECYSRDDFNDWSFDYQVDYKYDKKGRVIEEKEYCTGIQAFIEKIYYDEKGNISKVQLIEQSGTYEDITTVEYEYGWVN